MGGKGGGGSQTSNSTSQSLPPTYLMPYLKEFLALQNYLTTGSYGVNKKNPGTSQYPGPQQQIAGFNPNELSGLMGLGGAAGAQMGMAGQGAMTAENILSGQYLNPSSNPQLTAYYNAAAQPLSNQYQASTAPSNMSQAALSGAFGGSADAENRALSNYGFGNQLSNLAANIYEPAYQQGLNQITQTEGLLPSLTANMNTGPETLLSAGGIQQQQEQAGLNTQYQNQYNSSMWPYEMAQMLGGGFGQAGMGYGRQSGTQTTSGGGGGSKGGDIFGGLLGGAGLVGSMFPNFLPSIGTGASSFMSALPMLGKGMGF